MRINLLPAKGLHQWVPVVHFDFKKIKKVVHLIKKSYIWLNSKQLNIMNNLEQSYKKILEVLSKFFGKKLQNYQRRKPKMSDL